MLKLKMHQRIWNGNVGRMFSCSCSCSCSCLAVPGAGAGAVCAVNVKEVVHSGAKLVVQRQY